MNNTIIRRVIVLGAVSILSLLTVQTYWVLRTWDIAGTGIQPQGEPGDARCGHRPGANSTTLSLPPTTSYAKCLQLLGRQYRKPVRGQQPGIQPWARHFSNKNLKEDYKYGIFDCSSDQMVRANSSNIRPKTVPKNPWPSPAKALRQHFIYYFGVNFREKPPISSPICGL
jgi:hypothetical protein